MEAKKKHTGLKVFGIILLIIVVLVAGLIGIIYKSISDVQKGKRKIPDYESRLEIWDTVAGNSHKSKLSDMTVDPDQKWLAAAVDFNDVIVGSDYRDVKKQVDTYTYLHEIKPNYAKETYEDVPYLIPYLAKNSESAVIIIPGGGYANKSITSGNGEGKEVAKVLQKNGINAYVLNYRSNPYRYPIPQLDVQRAVRYLKYHASEYGLDVNKIGLIGYSAGGFQVGSYINLIQGNDLFPDDYIPDLVDRMDDAVAAPAMIYPALTFHYNLGMLFSIIDAQDVRDTQKRAEMLRLFDLKQHVQRSAHVPQLIAYGTSDSMVGDGPKEYIQAAKAAGVQVSEIIAKNAGHTFSQKYYMDSYLKWVKQIFD